MLAVAGVWVAINLLLMGLLVGVVLENDSFAFGQADLPEDVGLLALDLEPNAARIRNISKGSACTSKSAHCTQSCVTSLRPPNSRAYSVPTTALLI